MLMTKTTLRVLVLVGGVSSERAVSLRSGVAVQSALRTAGHSADIFDVTAIALPNNLHEYDVVFSVLHGKGGEDGAMQTLLESAEIRFVGSGAAASALCFDKWRYRELLQLHRLPMANGVLVSAEELWVSDYALHPFVLKPYDGGSSIDTFVVRDPKNPPRSAIAEAFTRHSKLLLETLIEGTECTAAVLGDQPLPLVEIIPPTDGEFDYNNKYNGRTQELCPPMHISLELQQKAQVLATRIHNLTGCRHYSRTDMIITRAGEIFVLETNTLPGMTDQSLLPKAAQAAGISMTELVDRLVRFAAKQA